MSLGAEEANVSFDDDFGVREVLKTAKGTNNVIFFVGCELQEISTE